MRRRTFLATTTALLASPVVGQTSATADAFKPLGQVDIGKTMDAVPSTDGQTAYVAATNGFATVDISDPADPAILAEIRKIVPPGADEHLHGIWDLEGDGDRLVVAGPAHGSPQLAGFFLYDVSDPAAPEQLAFFETDYPIHNLAFVDGVAYLTGNDGDRNPLVAVDCSDDQPEAVGRWSLLDHNEQWGNVPASLRTLHDVWVQDGMAYLAHWDAGTWIVDVSDPTSMSFVSRVRGRPVEELVGKGFSEYVQLPGNDHFVTVDEDASLLAIGSEAWDIEATEKVGGPGGIELYDISTPTEPRRLASIDAPETPDATRNGIWTTAHNFDLADGRLYTAWYRGGVTVHDVSEPADPYEIAAWADRDRASFFTAMATEECVIASSIADPAGAGTTEGLFTFPIPADKPRPADTPARTTTTQPTTAPPTSAPSTTTQPTTETTTTGEPTTMNRTTTEATETPGEGSGPGFGVLSGFVGSVAGGWYALRRLRSNSGE